MIVIFLTLGLVLGIYIGYKGTIKLMNKKMQEENEYLKEQLEKVKELSNYWATQAIDRNQHEQTTIQNHNLNLHNTLGTVIQLLQALQQNSNNNLSQEERKKVENIIQQAKGITSYNE